MKKFINPLILLIGLLLIACGGGENNANSSSNTGKTEEIKDNKVPQFTVSIDGKENNFEPTSSWATHWEKTFSKQQDGKTKTEKASHTEIVLANYELDSKDGKFSLAKQEITNPEQIKIEISFNGEKGTDSETPIKIGDYTIAPGEVFDIDKSFNKIDEVEIYHFVDGKEKETSLLPSKIKGILKITKIENNTISGSIDVTDGKKTVKGTFTANGDPTVK